MAISHQTTCPSLVPPPPSQVLQSLLSLLSLVAYITSTYYSTETEMYLFNSCKVDNAVELFFVAVFSLDFVLQFYLAESKLGARPSNTGVRPYAPHSPGTSNASTLVQLQTDEPHARAVPPAPQPSSGPFWRWPTC